MSSRELYKLVTFITMMVPLAFAACSTPTSKEATQVGADPPLRVATYAGLESLDPIWTTAYNVRSHSYLVYDTLFAMDQTGQPQPQMVATWAVSPDQKIWTFKLRDGLKWDDGTAVTSTDCIASLKRWSERDGMGQQLFGDVESLTAPDAKTIVMTLRAPDDSVLQALAKISSNVPFMMPQRVAETSAFQQIKDSTGSGPYMFVAKDWVPGLKAVYVKNPYYVPRSDPSSLAAGAKIAKADRIELIYYPHQADAARALINGYVQYMESPSTAVLPMLEADKGIAIEPSAPPGSIGMMRFNSLIPPFNNPQIRHAAIIAVNQADYMTAAFGTDHRWWTTCYSIYPCGTTYATDTGNWVMKLGNPAAAAYTLKKAGYDGTPVVILDPVDIPVLAAFTKVTAEELRKIGMNVEVQAMTWDQLVRRRVNDGPVAKGGWNLFDTWWMSADLKDPSAIAFSGNPVTGWYGGPADSTLEQDRLHFTQAASDADRREIAAMVQKQVLSNGTFAILGQFFEPIAYRANITGITSPVQFYWGLSN